MSVLQPVQLMHHLLAEQAAAPSKSMLEYIAEGREVGYLIILLSFVALGLIIAQFIRLRPSRLSPPESFARLDESLKHKDIKGAIAHCRDPGNDSFLTRVIGSALIRCSKSPFGFLEVKSVVEEAGRQEVAKLYRSTDPIGLIATVAPMLGLLGTVVGMVGAFDTLSVTEGVARPDALAGNISQALITTVMGLIVAIPCTAVFTYLRNRIDAQTSVVAQQIEELVSHLEAAQGGAAPSGGQPRPVGQRPVSPRQVPSA